MAIERHVDRAFVEPRRHHLGHEQPLRHARHLVHQRRPVLAAVARHGKAAVVGAGVQQAGAFRRFRQRHDRRPRLDAVMTRELNLAALHAHRLERVAILPGGEIAADRDPRQPAIRRAEDLVRGRVDDLRIVRREEERRVPVPAQRGLARRRGRPDPQRLPGDAIDAHDVPVLRLAERDAVVARVLEDDEAVAALERGPVIVGDADGAADLARSAPVVVVLHPAADVERDRHVVAHVVEEPDRQVRQERPGPGAIVGDRQSAVVADQHVVRVGRIDPDRMDVVVDRLGDVGGDRLAAVECLVQADAAEIDDLGVGRIDVDLAEVHRPRVGVVHLAPRRAGVVRTIHAGGLGVERATAAAAEAGFLRRGRGCRCRGARSFLGRRPPSAAAPAAAAAGRGCALDQRVHDVRALAIDVDRDAAERPVEDPALQPGEGVAAVG